jgi:hypothetical protein
MDLRLDSKRARVTGSTASVGYAIAEGLAQEGAEVIVNGRSAERVAEVAGSEISGDANGLGTCLFVYGSDKESTLETTLLVWDCLPIGRLGLPPLPDSILPTIGAPRQLAANRGLQEHRKNQPLQFPVHCPQVHAFQHHLERHTFVFDWASRMDRSRDRATFGVDTDSSRTPSKQDQAEHTKRWLKPGHHTRYQSNPRLAALDSKLCHYNERERLNSHVNGHS